MKTLSISTLTAICLLIMTICTSIAVAQTEISTIEDLNNARNDLTGDYVLTKDLDFAQGSSYASGTVDIAYRPQKEDGTLATTDQEIADATNAGWVPINPDFTGSFDGNGFTISNVYVNIKRGGAGLFSGIGREGRLQNVGVLDVYLKGKTRVGGLVASNERGAISNCYATGKALGIVGDDIRVGGLVGINYQGTITNCHAAVTVSGVGQIGGLVGINVKTITNCYATGAVSGTGQIGGLVGRNEKVGFIINSFWNKETTGQTSSAGSPDAGGLSTTDLQALNTAATATNENEQWNANDWEFGTNNQYPTLRSREASGLNQVQGFIMCNQPANYVPCLTTPTLLAAPLDFRTAFVPTTAQLVIAGRNLSGAITLGAIEVPFAYAEGQVLTFMPSEGGALKILIPITFTPTGLTQAHTSSVTATGGSLSQDVAIAITGFSVPPLTDTDGDNLLEINNIEQLNAVRNKLAGQYELTKNLDFAQGSSYATGVVNRAFRPLDNVNLAAAGPTDVEPANGQNPGFVPIGNDEFGDDAIPFTGTFEGNGFAISNLYINNSKGRVAVGLFGATKGGSRVQNLGIVDAYLVQRGGGGDKSYLGGLVGFNDGGTISNCYFTGTVTGPTGGVAAPVGGLVGLNKTGTITNCYTSGTVSGTLGGHIALGGLVGANRDSISNCYSSATNLNGSGSSFSTSVGGLVGSNSGPITNCYATGNVTGATFGRSYKGDKRLRLGGLVGQNNSGGTISNSYATGNVDAKDTRSEDLYIGGVTGGGSGTVSNCFWNKETTKQTSSPGSEDTAGLSTADFKALTTTSATWNTNDWAFGTDNEYPTLRSREAIDQNQAQGFIICNQPTNYAPCTTTPVLNGSPIDFGNAAEPITLRMLIVAKNLSSNVTLSALEAPFSYAEGQALTFKPDFNRAIVPITFTPPNMAQTYNGSVIITGGGLTSNVVIAITGEVIPALTLNPSELTFGDLSTDATPTTQEYTITGINLTEDVSLALAGEGMDAFSITHPTNTTLTPTDGALSQAVTITFNPTAEQEYTATITHTGGGLTNSLVLTIAGRGTAPTTTPNAGVLGLEIGFENPNTTAIRLSPNPVTDRLYIQGNGTLQVQVRNILGATLLVTKIIETGDINVSTLPPGLYLVSVQSTTRTQTQRILKR